MICCVVLEMWLFSWHATKGVCYCCLEHFRDCEIVGEYLVNCDSRQLCLHVSSIKYVSCMESREGNYTHALNICDQFVFCSVILFICDPC